MQSISAPSIHIYPVDTKEPDQKENDGLYMEKLLDKIFGEELEKALASESDNDVLSNLVSFPLMQELINLQPEDAVTSETLDFSPSAFAANDPVLETDLTRFTPSIIERDDVDFGHMQALIDAQQEQLAGLRGDLKLKDTIIRLQAVDLAAKDDQLKYLPELFNKSLMLAGAEAANHLLTKDLEVERLVNDELNSELAKTRSDLAQINNHLLVKFARVLGVISQP